MRIVLVNQFSTEPETIEIDSNTDFGTFEMIAGSYVNIDPKDIVIMKDGKVITGKTSASITSLNIKDGDVLAVSKKGPVPKPSTSRSQIDFSSINASSLFNRPNTAPTRRSPISESEQVRQQLLKLNPSMLSQYRNYNPKLIESLNNAEQFAVAYNEQQEQILAQRRELDQLHSADVMDPTTQARIEELIKRNNINSQMEHAMEHNPESFAQTTMLYVLCKVNKHDVKAFVDSGAQMTFISLDFARRSHVDHLIDARWRGVARGVGTQQIAGRVHCIELEISGAFLQMSVSVLEDQEMDMLIGLDLLKRYQCIINLRRNVLEISSYNVETPFLPESQLPAHARLNNAASATVAMTTVENNVDDDDSNFGDSLL